MSEKNNFIAQQSVDFISGFIAGIICAGTICAGIFHPIDRAYYLSMKENRPFLTKINFIHPWHGLNQTLLHRSIIGSSYYIVQAKMNDFITSNVPANDLGQRSVVGLSAGASYSLMTNTAAMIKAHTWPDSSRTFITSFKDIISTQGWRTLARGQKASLSRDTVHGSTYEILRYELNKQSQTHLSVEVYSQYQNSIHFINNCCAACIGTSLGSPFNYARTIQFATSPQETLPTVSAILKNFLTEARSYSTIGGQLLFFQKKLRIGIGTGRAALGMAVGQLIFDEAREILNESNKKNLRFP